MGSVEPEISTGANSATRRTYQTLRRMIVNGELGPGEKLKIDELRHRLDTGASPIREALSLLTSDNLVERFDQRGFRTAKISANNFEEILLLRCTLEDLALRESIAKGTQNWEDRVVLSHHRMAKAMKDGAPDQEECHKVFHMALLGNAESPILLKFCSQLYDLNIRYRNLAGSNLKHKKRNVGEEHERIMSATLERDAETASEHLRRHYRTTGAFLAGQLGMCENG